MNLYIKLAAWIIISGIVIGLGMDMDMKSLCVGGIFSAVIAVAYLLGSYLK
jgi:hypothetical protein